MPTSATPFDAHFAERVHASFARQQVMRLIGATLVGVAPGAVEIRLPFRADLTQQHGYLHAGVVTTICDSACGYAALSRMAPGSGVLTVEFKMNLLAPARGEWFAARGMVTKAGRTLLFCQGEVRAHSGATDGGAEEGEPPLVATMMATMMRIEERDSATV
jgi:uncharacterized protein (TIGR00369 family)